MTTKPQHVVKLEASNVKRLKAVKVEPGKGGLVVVGGKNAAGKSSLLGAIEMAIRGPRAAPAEPVRKGSTKAQIVLESEDYVIKRTCSKGKWSLVAETKNGSRIASPQKLFDAMASELTFDPLSFVRAKPRDQVDMVRRLTGLDTAELDTRRESYYSERTAVNRDIKRLMGVIESIELPDEIPDPINVAGIKAELARAEESNAKIGKATAELQALREKRDRIKAVIVEQEKELAAVNQRGSTIKGWLDAVVAVDTTPLLDEMGRAADVANQRSEAERKQRAQGELDQAIDKSERLTTEIEAVDLEKREALAKLELPDGLEVTDDCLRLGGVPLDQASLAQQISLSVALGVAPNPDWRIMLVHEGSSLDSEHMALLAKLAADHEAQLWVEVASDDGKGASVVIEDGEVKA
jgi:DNA repair exonuclease SbcCD ATPase subunit